MKNKVLMIAAAMILTSNIVHAESTDSSASLQITGKLTAAQTDTCAMSLSQNSVAVNESMDDLISEGLNNPRSIGQAVTIQLSGAQCLRLADEGEVAYRFIGAADSSGKVLANNDTSPSGAKGIGMGIFGTDKNPISVNNGYFLAKSTAQSFNLAMVKLYDQTPVAGNYQGTLTVEVVHL